MALYDFSARTLDGQEHSLSDYRGKVLLIVNTASKCGFTPQFEGLQALYDELGGDGLEILGFPCNQFGHQEPGDAEQIGAFCEKNYGVSFPMFEKIEVNGDGAHPLYKFLKAEAPGLFGTGAIKWNFTKFLVDRDGRVVRRYGSKDKPQKIAADIRKLL